MRDARGPRGSYGRFAWALLPAWLIALVMLADLAGRMGGAAQIVAWVAIGFTGIASVLFFTMWIVGQRDAPGEEDR